MQLVKDYSKDQLREMTTDELLDIVQELPARLFGYREFEALQKAESATLADNYPQGMTVIDIETEDHETVTVLLKDTRDVGFKEPVFIG